MFVEELHLLGVALHDVVDLLQLVGQPLLAAEFVLLQRQDQLFIVLHSITETGDQMYIHFDVLDVEMFPKCIIICFGSNLRV